VCVLYGICTVVSLTVDRTLCTDSANNVTQECTVLVVVVGYVLTICSDCGELRILIKKYVIQPGYASDVEPAGKLDS